ncbi:MAG: methylated-DNA--[protein]-cysteine S-methyltransferase [Arenibacterium sp.]
MGQIDVASPVGPLAITAQDGAITALTWGCARDEAGDEAALLEQAKSQIDAYFRGELTRFDLPLSVQGSELQRQVCAAMSAIPFGETRTYGEIAEELGVPAQAIGQACGGNPIPIIIPCHRVLSATGLGGFSAAGGVETKVALLRHEGAASLLI